MNKFLNIENNNSIKFILSDGSEITDFTGDEIDLVNLSPIKVKGENNDIRIKVKQREDIKTFLERKGFILYVFGFDNTIDIGIVNTYHDNILGLTGLHIFVGNDNDPYLEPDRMRSASNCRVLIGDNTVFCGARLFLQDDDSSISIGENCMFSWGIDVWCTDVHTITDMDGNPLNYGKSIEIGSHVWVGRDVKIGKNTKISDDSIVGWGSVVTKKFGQSNIIIAGNPAKIVKTDINWDARDLQSYNLYRKCMVK